MQDGKDSVMLHEAEQSAWCDECLDTVLELGRPVGPDMLSCPLNEWEDITQESSH